MLPRLCCDVVNSGLWTVYGLMAGDPYIIVPNATGVTLGLAQAVLKALFWKRPAAAAERAGSVGADADAVRCAGEGRGGLACSGQGLAWRGSQQACDS